MIAAFPFRNQDVFFLMRIYLTIQVITRLSCFDLGIKELNGIFYTINDWLSSLFFPLFRLLVFSCWYWLSELGTPNVLIKDVGSRVYGIFEIGGQPQGLPCFACEILCLLAGVKFGVPAGCSVPSPTSHATPRDICVFRVRSRCRQTLHPVRRKYGYTRVKLQFFVF